MRTKNLRFRRLYSAFLIALYSAWFMRYFTVSDAQILEPSQQFLLAVEREARLTVLALVIIEDSQVVQRMSHLRVFRS